MLIFPAWRLTKAIFDKDPLAVMVAAGLSGCLLVGVFDSLFDEPRITFLFTLMIWLGALTRGRQDSETPPTKAKTRTKSRVKKRRRRGGGAYPAGRTRRGVPAEET